MSVEHICNDCDEPIADGGSGACACPPPEPLFYILDLRPNRMSPSALWWAPESRGYTNDLRRAGKFSQAEAKSITSGDDCRAIPCEAAESYSCLSLQIWHADIDAMLRHAGVDAPPKNRRRR